VILSSYKGGQIKHSGTWFM